MFKLRLPEVDKNIKVTGKSVFSLYLTYKNHMEGRYDAVKYNFNTNISNAAYQKRKDKFFFEKLSKKYTFIQLVVLFLSNNINDSFWVGDIESEDCLETYRKFLGNMRKIKSNFVDDIKSLFYFSKTKGIDIKDVLYDREKSYLIRLVKHDIIQVETLILLDSIMGILEKYTKEDLAWNNMIVRYTGYKNLAIIDTEMTKTLFIKTVKEIKENNYV